MLWRDTVSTVTVGSCTKHSLQCSLEGCVKESNCYAWYCCHFLMSQLSKVCRSRAQRIAETMVGLGNNVM